MQNLRDACDSTSFIDLLDEGLPRNYHAVLARCELGRSNLGLIDGDGEHLGTLVDSTRSMLAANPRGFLDDSLTRFGRYDIYTADVHLFCEPLADRLGPTWRHGMQAALDLVRRTASPDGSAIGWGRSTGALSVCLTTELAALAIERAMTDEPGAWLALAGAAAGNLDGWFDDDGIITAHVDRSTYFYRGPERRLQMSVDCLGKIAEAGRRLQAAEFRRGDRPRRGAARAGRLGALRRRERGRLDRPHSPDRVHLPGHRVDGERLSPCPAPAEATRRRGSGPAARRHPRDLEGRQAVRRRRPARRHRTRRPRAHLDPGRLSRRGQVRGGRQGRPRRRAERQLDGRGTVADRPRAVAVRRNARPDRVAVGRGRRRAGVVDGHVRHATPTRHRRHRRTQGVAELLGDAPPPASGHLRARRVDRGHDQADHQAPGRLDGLRAPLRPGDLPRDPRRRRRAALALAARRREHAGRRRVARPVPPALARMGGLRRRRGPRCDHRAAPLRRCPDRLDTAQPHAPQQGTRQVRDGLRPLGCRSRRRDPPHCVGT